MQANWVPKDGRDFESSPILAAWCWSKAKACRYSYWSAMVVVKALIRTGS